MGFRSSLPLFCASYFIQKQNESSLIPFIVWNIFVVMVLVPSHVAPEGTSPLGSPPVSSGWQIGGSTSEGSTNSYAQSPALTTVQGTRTAPDPLASTSDLLTGDLGRVGPEQTLGERTGGLSWVWPEEPPLAASPSNSHGCYRAFQNHNFLTHCLLHFTVGRHFWEFWDSGSKGKLFTGNWNSMNIWVLWHI